MYRINFGNGQVHGDWDTLAEAQRHFAICVTDGIGFLQKYMGDGMWVRVK